MEFTLEMLMSEVGCERYPERWADIFVEAMKEYDRRGCYLAETEFYDSLNEKYGCFEEHESVYKAAALQVAKDEVLGRFLTLLVVALRDDVHRDEDLGNFSRPVTPEGKDPLGYEMVTGLAICSQLEKAVSNMKKRGIPINIICENLKLPINGVQSYASRHNGKPGFDLLTWFQESINANLFQIGRLQFEIKSKFWQKVIAFQNAKREIIVLANGMELHRDGFALGAKNYEDSTGAWKPIVEETNDAWIGCPCQKNGYVDANKIVLNKSEWKIVLREGDSVIRLHIPSGGKMLSQEIDQSIATARMFVETHFPEYQYKAFACYSWLMDPQLCQMLDEESNIVKFKKRFHSLTIKSQGEGVFFFVFNNPEMKFSIKDLPENTSLEKALKRHYLDGKVIYEFEGFFI